MCYACVMSTETVSVGLHLARQAKRRVMQYILIYILQIAEHYLIISGRERAWMIWYILPCVFLTDALLKTNMAMAIPCRLATTDDSTAATNYNHQIVMYWLKFAVCRKNMKSEEGCIACFMYRYLKLWQWISHGLDWKLIRNLDRKPNVYLLTK